MFGKKRREIADLKRLLRIQAGTLAATQEDLRATRYAARRAAELVDAQQSDPAAVDASADVERSELWSLIDWSLWGSGMGDTFREALADQFISSITPEQHQQALELIRWWTEDRGRTPLGRRRYEDLQARLHRAVRGCARARASEGKAVALLVQLQQSYDHAVGLDHPDIEAGSRWQARRIDKVRGIVQ